MNTKFNQEEFDRLPALLTRAETMAWTGLGRDELTLAAREKEVRTYPEWKEQRKRKGRRQHKYFKADVAKICGLTI